jgi:hypothetical protein
MGYRRRPRPSTSPDNWIFKVDLREPADIQDEPMAWLREACGIGAQCRRIRARTGLAGGESGCPRAGGREVVWCV